MPFVRLARIFAPWLLALAALSGCSTQPPAGVTVVTPFDLARYEGRWYEIARLDHSFERGLTDVSATYLRQSDGSVQVVNRGYDAQGGRWKEAIGKALFTGSPSVASLKVSFFGPFYGGYHVVDLDDNGYRWSMVIGPDRDYLWILARDKTIAPDVRERLIARAAALGVDVSKLIWVSHTRLDA
jgi:apolipoprotein D and lipocalin family protein